MTTMEPVDSPVKRFGWVTPAVIGLLLVVRIGLLGLVAALARPTPAWLDPFYQVATYLLTLFLIYWERDHLRDFHISWLAVGIILIFKPVETLFLALVNMETAFPMAFPRLPALVVWAAALALLVWILAAKPAFPPITRKEWRWFGLGVLVGIVSAAALSVPMAAQVRLMGIEPQFGLMGPVSFLIMFARDFLYQLGYAAVSEEPLFRGFLWGYLLRLGWKDRWVWLLQAGLFSLAHIYYAGQMPYSFWIIVPVGALVMGWLAWCSRSIATSMAAHAALNALGYFLGQVVAKWFF